MHATALTRTQTHTPAASQEILRLQQAKRQEIKEMHSLHEQHTKRLESMQAEVEKASRRITAWAHACVTNFTHSLKNMMKELQQVHSENISKALSKARGNEYVNL